MTGNFHVRLVGGRGMSPQEASPCRPKADTDKYYIFVFCSFPELIF
jgi:hypothetical protein